MSNNTKDKLKYIPNKRYIVEIKDEKSGRLFYTKRVKRERDADSIRKEYNILKSMSAKILDTKLGQIY